MINETKQLISPKDAKEQGFAIPDIDVKYQDGEFKIPKKTAIAYKVFYLKDGKLYPPVIANTDAKPTPIGVWLPASSPNIVGYTLKDHRPQVMSGGKGTRGQSLGALAFRPGWHMGEIPYAEQFLKRKTINGIPVWDKNLVWAEVEYSNDIDYQDKAMSYGYSPNGKFRHSYAGLPAIPKNGSYKYRTNPNPKTVPWVIAGAMKVNKVLSFEEVDKILKQHGITPPIVMSDAEYKQKTIGENKIMESKKEMTRHAFINGMESFMRQLFKDPRKAETNDVLQSYGIDGRKAVEILTKPTDKSYPESAILIKKTGIKQTIGQDGSKKDEFKIRYSIPRKDYLKKMRNLYISLFENNIVEGTIINEDGEGGCTAIAAVDTAGATNAQSSGQYNAPIGKPIRRTFYMTREQADVIAEMATTDAGDYTYNVPLSISKKDPSMDHKNMIQKSFQGK